MVDAQQPKPPAETLAKLRASFLRPGKGDPSFLERQSLVRALQDLCRHIQHGVILDIGCGIKPYKPLLARPGDRWVGVDHPTTMAGSYGAITLADTFADCHALPFADGVFDTALCTQVLEHVPDPARVLAEAARVLRPGGVLLLTAPMTWPLHEEPFDFFRYTQHGLRYLLHGVGFEVLQEIQRGRGASTLGQAFLDLQFAARRLSFPGKLYKQGLCRVVNQCCEWLDRCTPSHRLALGWAVAARKLAPRQVPAESSANRG